MVVLVLIPWRHKRVSPLDATPYARNVPDNFLNFPNESTNHNAQSLRNKIFLRTNCARVVEAGFHGEILYTNQMKLDEAQRLAVTKWIADGAKLSEIQNRLATEFGLKLTYMEARFLVDDLKLTPKDPEPPKVVAPPVAPATTPLTTQPIPTAPVGGNVTVTVDQITKPGTMISGKVAFSDGQLADWYLDQPGRLGVVPKQQGYKPTAEDVKEFQLALQQEVAKLGY